MDATESILRLKHMLHHCALCPRGCGVDRTAAQRGECQTGETAVVASYGPHFGEEYVLVGTGGSGTIFFAGCNLHCIFCQNYDISQQIVGRLMSPGQLADVMLELAGQGCVNINFVSPTHVAHAAAEAIFLSRRRGLSVPVVWNCGGYESVAVLRCLEGLVDIYMPDFKWAGAEAGEKYSGVREYPRIAQEALAEMYRQVGPLRVDGRGLAARGVLVRHLVMPSDLAGSAQVIELVAAAAPGCAINVMSQYRPAYRATERSELLGGVAAVRIRKLRKQASELGLQVL